MLENPDQKNPTGSLPLQHPNTDYAKDSKSADEWLLSECRTPVIDGAAEIKIL